MSKWISVGIIYGLIGLLIGTILAAARTSIFIPYFGESISVLIEFGLAAVCITISGLWLMHRFGGWTTNSALYFGGTGALVYFAIGLSLNLLILGDGASTAMYEATMTHGSLFPVAFLVMSLAPAVLTQRA